MTNQRITPRTWANEDFMTAALLNAQLRDASEFLKNRPFANTVMTAIVNTTSTSFVEITDSRTTLVCTGGNVLLATCGIQSSNTAGGITSYDIAIDGARYGDTTVGLTQITSHSTLPLGYADCLSVVWFTTTPPSAGSHVFSLYWKVSTGESGMYTRFFALEIR